MSVNTKDLQNVLADYIYQKWVFPYVFYAVALMHLIWGVGCLLSDAPLHTVGIENIYILSDSWLVTGLIFLTTSLLGIVFAQKSSILAAAALGPQQFLLILSASRAIISIVQGHFADNSVYPAWFIAVDTLSLIIITIIHAVPYLALVMSVFIRRRNLPEGTLSVCSKSDL